MLSIPCPYVSDCMVAIVSSELYYKLLHKLCADSVHQALFPPPPDSEPEFEAMQVYTKYIILLRLVPVALSKSYLVNLQVSKLVRSIGLINQIVVFVIVIF